MTPDTMRALSSGRFAVIPAVIIDDQRVGHAAVRVYAMLATHATPEGWAWPALGLLASRLGNTRQAVQQQIRELEKYGYIRTEPMTRSDGSQGANRYFLVFDNLGNRREPVGSDSTVGGAQDTTGSPQDEIESPQDEIESLQHKLAPYSKNKPIEQEHGTNIDAGRLQKFRESFPSTPYWSDKGVRAALNKAIREGADFKAIVHGARVYRAECEARDWYSPCGPVRWLDEKRWTNAEPPAEQTAPTPEPVAQPKLSKEKAAWWEALCELARKAMGEAKFNSWFARLIYDGNTIWAPSAFVRDSFANEFEVRPELREILKDIPMKVGVPPSAQNEVRS